jgi:hypothetical protein
MNFTGGELNTNRTITLGTPSSITSSSTDSVSPSSHTHLLADNAVTRDKINAGAVSRGKIADGAVNDIKLADSAVTRAKLANISDNRVLGRLNEGSSGTVQEVTVRTDVRSAGNATNNQLATEKAVRDAISDATSGAGVGTVGSYALLKLFNGNDSVNAGNTRSGSALEYSNARGANESRVRPSGTWRAMGSTREYDEFDDRGVTVWLRIS